MVAPRFPNVERILVADFTAWQGQDGVSVGGVTPADLQARLPFIRVRRAGGTTDDVSDLPFVTIEVFDSTDAGATDIAEAVRQRLLDGYIRNTHGQMDRAECVSPHQELPWPNPAIRRIATTYRLACRRLPSMSA